MTLERTAIALCAVSALLTSGCVLSPEVHDSDALGRRRAGGGGGSVEQRLKVRMHVENPNDRASADQGHRLYARGRGPAVREWRVGGELRRAGARRDGVRHERDHQLAGTLIRLLGRGPDARRASPTTSPEVSLSRAGCARFPSSSAARSGCSRRPAPPVAAQRRRSRGTRLCAAQEKSCAMPLLLHRAHCTGCAYRSSAVFERPLQRRSVEVVEHDPVPRAARGIVVLDRVGESAGAAHERTVP